MSEIPHFRDWRNVRERRQRAIGATHEQLTHEREIKALRAERDCSRAEAVRQLRYDDVEVEG